MGNFLIQLIYLHFYSQSQWFFNHFSVEAMTSLRVLFLWKWVSLELYTQTIISSVVFWRRRRTQRKWWLIPQSAENDSIKNNRDRRNCISKRAFSMPFAQLKESREERKYSQLGWGESYEMPNVNSQVRLPKVKDESRFVSRQCLLQLHFCGEFRSCWG